MSEENRSVNLDEWHPNPEVLNYPPENLTGPLEAIYDGTIWTIGCVVVLILGGPAALPGFLIPAVVMCVLLSVMHAIMMRRGKRIEDSVRAAAASGATEIEVSGSWPWYPRI